MSPSPRHTPASVHAEVAEVRAKHEALAAGFERFFTDLRGAVDRVSENVEKVRSGMATREQVQALEHELKEVDRRVRAQQPTVDQVPGLAQRQREMEEAVASMKAVVQSLPVQVQQQVTAAFAPYAQLPAQVQTVSMKLVPLETVPAQVQALQSDKDQKAGGLALGKWLLTGGLVSIGTLLGAFVTYLKLHP